MVKNHMTEQERLEEVKEDWKGGFFKFVRGKINNPTEEEITRAYDEVNLNALDAVAMVKNSDSFCEMCGECCRISNPIRLSNRDLKVLRTLSFDIEEYIEKEDEKWQLKETQPCAFLNGDNTCQIHRKRPEVCRIFPVKEEGVRLGVRIFDYCNFVKNYVFSKGVTILIMKRLKDEDYETFRCLEREIEEGMETCEGETPLERMINFSEKF